MIGVVLGTSEKAREITEFLAEHLTVCPVINATSIDEVKTEKHIAFVAAIAPDGELSASDIFLPVLRLYPLTRVIILTEQRELSGVSQLADQGKIDQLTYLPQFNERQFLNNLLDQVRRYCQRANIPSPVQAPNRDSFIFAIPETDREIMDRIVKSVDECLGYQPRIVIPPGVRLTVEGSLVEEATLALSGKIALERGSHAGNVLMHHASTGQIIGLLSMTSHRKAFFTSRTTTEVVGVHLSFEQLNYVIQARPETALLFAVLFIRSLDRRLRRSEDIQIEKVELTAELEAQKRQLAQALSNLEAARAELMSQARFASLGELAAGVAHELNNPMAAIARAADYILEDVEGLLRTGKDPWASQAIAAITSAHEAPSLSTREARLLRKELTEATGSQEIAQRLALAGIRDTKLAKSVKAKNLPALEHAAAIGTGVRNLESASRRIRHLVASLRSYARPDGDPVADVDIHETLDDTIRLVQHKLKGIEVTRDYADLPVISCHPGLLSQVWTNLMTNAAEAMTEVASDPANVGTIKVSTEAAEPGWIRVIIKDSGPGIPDAIIDKIFEPRFTTKSGQVRFGMGIGLGVCKAIVGKHNGRIRLESSHDGTAAIVDLPLEES